MPVSAAYARETQYPEYPVLCRSLAGLVVTTKRQTRTRGDDIIARYDAQAGERAARDREAELAGWLDRHVQARPGALASIRKRVPSAPGELGRGVRSPQVRTQIRAERFEGWGFERLLAALNACGYEVALSVRPKAAA